MRRGGRERQGEDEQAERQGHGMAGVNEAEAKGQTGGHEKGPGLPPRQRDHGGGQEAGTRWAPSYCQKGKATIYLTYLHVL